MRTILNLVPFLINDSKHTISKWISVTFDDLILLSNQEVYDHDDRRIKYDITYKYFGSEESSLNEFEGTNHDIQVSARMEFLVRKIIQ